MPRISLATYREILWCIPHSPLNEVVRSDVLEGNLVHGSGCSSEGKTDSSDIEVVPKQTYLLKVGRVDDVLFARPTAKSERSSRRHRDATPLDRAFIRRC